MQHKDREALPMTERAFVLQKQEKQSTLVILLLNILTSLCINSFHIFCDFYLQDRHQGQPNDNKVNRNALCSAGTNRMHAIRRADTTKERISQGLIPSARTQIGSVLER